MRYLIMLVYFLIYKNKTFLTGYMNNKKNTLELYWGHYSDNPNKFIFREKVIRNIYFKYRDKKLLSEALKMQDEVICIDSCPLKTNNPIVVEFDTYA